MLKILTRNNPLLYLAPKRSFGSGSGPVNVQIDRNAKWIKFNSNRKLACVQGIKDIHYRTIELVEEDPYAHLKNSPYFSFNNLVYNDAWYHEPEHQLYADEPKGYLTGDDPNDMRYDVFGPTLAVMATFFAISTFFGYMTFDTFNEEQILHEAQFMEQRIDEILSKKKEKIERLQREIEELAQRQ